MHIPDWPRYTSNVIPVPMHAAPVVFEGWWLQRRRSAGLRVEVIAVGRGRLALAPTTWDRSASGPVAPHRRVRGALLAPGRRAWPVELELTPWSASHSELGLRFRGRRSVAGRRLASYHRLAAMVLDVIGSELVERCPVEDELPARQPNAA